MNDDEQLVPLFMPSLIEMLARFERRKGSLLTQEEVLDIRDNAIVMRVRKSVLSQMSESRGYDDLDPEQCWEQWQIARVQFDIPDDTSGG